MWVMRGWKMRDREEEKGLLTLAIEGGLPRQMRSRWFEPPRRRARRPGSEIGSGTGTRGAGPRALVHRRLRRSTLEHRTTVAAIATWPAVICCLCVQMNVVGSMRLLPGGRQAGGRSPCAARQAGCTLRSLRACGASPPLCVHARPPNVDTRRFTISANEARDAMEGCTLRRSRLARTVAAR